MSWLAAAAALNGGCRCGGSLHQNAAFEIPQTNGPITIDGQCVEKSWPASFHSPLFQDNHGRTAPFTQLLATSDERYLYLCVYVGDVDIESAGDKVQVDVGPLRIVLRPRNSTAPEGVDVATATDDTIDKASDYDEEWVGEVAVPWSLLGSREIAVRAFRVDVGHGDAPHALAWPRYARALFRTAGGS